ncbi:hypothetical protein D3C83_316400 [compost metagenome]
MVGDDEKHSVVPVRLHTRAIEKSAERIVRILDRIVDGVGIVLVVRLDASIGIFVR